MTQREKALAAGIAIYHKGSKSYKTLKPREKCIFNVMDFDVLMSLGGFYYYAEHRGLRNLLAAKKSFSEIGSNDDVQILNGFIEITRLMTSPNATKKKKDISGLKTNISEKIESLGEAYSKLSRKRNRLLLFYLKKEF
jgi:hypothetical protein